MESVDSKWEKRLRRERIARQEAERFLEEKSRELYQANRNLLQQARDLEILVAERTRRLADNESGLVELNRVLIGLRGDFEDNIERLTHVCGDVLRADAVRFCIADGFDLRLAKVWLADVSAQPPMAVDMCRTIAMRGPDKGLCITSELGQDSGNYRLGAGYPVVYRGELRGVLTAFFKTHIVLDPFCEQILEIIATALGSELARDITQQELAEKERRFTEVFQRSMDGIIIHDINGQIIDVNRTAARLFGFRIRDIIGMTLPDLHPREWLPVCKTAMEKVTTSGAHRFEAEFLRHDGSTFLAEISASSFELGNQKLVQGIIRDITEKRRLENEREESARDLARAKDEAERANAAKSVFMANLSHEIRTPLNGIIGFADVLAETGMNEKQRNFLNTIRASGEVLLHIINDTLDLSRIERGRIELNDDVFSPAACVTESAAILMAKAGEEKLKLTAEISPDVPAEIRGDANRLRQVLLNLINNALKFTEEGGVTVRLDRDPRAPEDQLRFEIEDTGVGISAADRDRLFQPFTQFGEGRERREGAGLGLAICKSLVEMMGGIIRCESTPGKGSRFWFTIPIRNHGASPSHQSLRIAVVARNGINRQLLVAFAEKAGHQAEEGQDLRQALDDHGYDAIIADAEALPSFEETEGPLRSEDLDRLVTLIGDATEALPQVADNRKIFLPIDPHRVETVLSNCAKRRV